MIDLSVIDDNGAVVNVSSFTFEVWALLPGASVAQNWTSYFASTDAPNGKGTLTVPHTVTKTLVAGDVQIEFWDAASNACLAKGIATFEATIRPVTD